MSFTIRPHINEDSRYTSFKNKELQQYFKQDNVRMIKGCRVTASYNFIIAQALKELKADAYCATTFSQKIGPRLTRNAWVKVLTDDEKNITKGIHKLENKIAGRRNGPKSILLNTIKEAAGRRLTTAQLSNDHATLQDMLQDVQKGITAFNKIKV
mgnify:CR=1 FL=1|jgi:hypothetical protein